MKRLGYALLLTTLAVSLSEAKIFKAYNGDIDFNHSKHMGMYPCTECHEGPPRPFPGGIDKAKAHKLCLGCHKKEGAGPLRHCGECHGNTKKD
jgi:predicted CXXCH cytochrome family protein